MSMKTQSSPSIPVIETDRLRLRAPNMADWSLYAAFMASDRAAHMGGPFTKAAAWGMFCHDVAQWQLMGHGSLMIDKRVDGTSIGQVGINAGPLFPEHELGWLLYPGSEGQGYALEAAAALRNWGFNVLGLTTLVSYIHRDNDKSRRLAERLGALLDETAERHDPEDIVYRHVVMPT
ncbi:GNAT family N-acetyltransferase [Rhizobium sp.]|uniref:GNAT family N-acetyltransferase n=1 Tax=Rhizobium sp. TaxID=391 RepID=UPI0028AA672A